MVHKYQVYRDPFPHPALRGRVMNKLLALVALGHGHCAIDAKLHISIPASGLAGGAVPEECFPTVPLPRVSVDPRRVSFASEVTVMGASPESEWLPDPVPVDLPDIQIHNPVYPCIPEEDDMDVSTEVSDPNFPVLPPPPGFECFAWTKATGGPGGDPSLFDFSAELPGWFPMGLVSASGDQPLLPISPILSNSLEESVVGSPADSLIKPDTPSGPFLSERSPSSLNCFGDGYSFRHTTYRPSDYTRPSGEL